MLTTRDRTDELGELERLWEAPAVHEPLPQRHPIKRRPRIEAIYLIWGWVAWLFAGVVLSPAAEPHAATPLWVDAATVGMFLLLAGAWLLGLVLPRLGFAAVTGAGGVGMALSVACRTTEHHLGSWWMVELGVAALLTGLAAAGLAERLRRK